MISFVSFDCHVITRGDAGGGDQIVERKAYMNQAQACSYIQKINLNDPDRPRKVNKDKLVIRFSKNYLSGVMYPQDDPLVVKFRIQDAIIARVLIDNGSSVDIILYPYFQSLGLTLSQLEPYHRLLIGFSVKKVYPLGSVKLEVLFGTWPTSRIEKICLFVMDKNVQSSYNVIFNRAELKKFEVVPSIIYQCL